MYISKLKVKNFKCFQDVEFEFNSNFNLIIGENNSGKSTIFEALRLWQLAFNKFLKDRTNNKQSSFRNTQYYTFTLDEIYKFEKILRTKYPSNNFVKDKIRQQLQILRDKGVISFMGRGVYKKDF